MERELANLKKDQIRKVNSIRAALHKHGLKVPSISKDFPQWLESIRRWDGSCLPEGIKGRIMLAYLQLSYTRELIADCEKLRRKLLKEDKSAASETARKLKTLKGIGMNGAWVISTELLSWRNFNNCKQVGSIAGLTGTPYDSGGTIREQGIDKAGNKRVRGVIVELAWCWVRHQPRSDLTLWFQERYGSGNKRLRKIGIVALSRKLLIALWRWVDQDLMPQDAILKS